MSLSSFIDDALKDMELDVDSIDGLTQAFTWHGVQVPCVPGTHDHGVDISPDGNTITTRLTLTVRAAHFHDASEDSPLPSDSDATADEDMPRPSVGRQLVFRGTTYVITGVRTSPTGVYLTLTLSDPGSNR